MTDSRRSYRSRFPASWPLIRMGKPDFLQDGPSPLAGARLSGSWPLGCCPEPGFLEVGLWSLGGPGFLEVGRSAAVRSPVSCKLGCRHWVAPDFLEVGRSPVGRSSLFTRIARRGGPAALQDPCHRSAERLPEGGTRPSRRALTPSSTGGFGARRQRSVILSSRDCAHVRTRHAAESACECGHAGALGGDETR
jgi:hypothetical protein